MIRIAHVSDPHFGTILPGVREGLLATLLELRPDGVVLTGDITQRAHADQFKEACAFKGALADAGIPLMAAPGNHDIPLFNVFGRLIAPYSGYRRHCHPTLHESWEKGGVRVDLLNSTSRWRIVQGALHGDELARVREVSGAPPQVRIVGFHHPMDCAKHIDDHNLIRNREWASRVFAQAGVDLVLGGHIHDPYVSTSQDRYPGLERSFVVTVAGTCMSWRTRERAPNSFNCIEVECGGGVGSGEGAVGSAGGGAVPARLTVVRHDIRGDQRFAPVQAHHFVRGPGGWSRAPGLQDVV